MTEEAKATETQYPLLKGDTFALPGEIINLPVPATGARRQALLDLAGKEVFLATLKNPQLITSAATGEVHETGIIARVTEVVPTGPASVMIFLAARSPAKLVEQSPDFFSAKVVTQERPDVSNDDEFFELAYQTVEKLIEFAEAQNPMIAAQISAQVNAALEKAPGLLPYVAMRIVGDIEPEKKKELLEITDPKDQLKFVQGYIEEISVKLSIQEETQAKLQNEQQIYILRQQQQAIDKKIKELGGGGDDENDLDALERKLRKAGMPAEALKKCESDLKKLRKMSPNDPSGTVLRTVLDEIAAFPWSVKSEVNTDMNKAQEALDRDHSGLEKPKEKILEKLAVQQRTGQSGGVFGLEGPPGVGKTSLGQSIADAMGRKFVKVSLGGVREESTIRGHRRTFVGAEAGRIMNAIKEAGTLNPVVLLDEVDKIGAKDGDGSRSSAVENALLELLDPSQNNKFRDHYYDVDVDLKDVLFIATANYLQNVPAPLLDRIPFIHLEGYTDGEKMDIAKAHIIGKKAKEAGLEPAEFSITDAALEKLIDDYTREEGVRSLQQAIEALAGKVVKEILTTDTKSVKITPENLEKYLGKAKVIPERVEDQDLVGHANGLYVSGSGGGILPFDAILIPVKPGTGSFEITGMLQDVMKESSKDAYDFVRSNAKELGIPREVLENNIVRIKANDGATPKDGPSAGLLMATVITSVATGIPVRHDIAMTGEIGLTGKSMPIGGMRQKLTGAMKAGVKTVFVPQSNYDRDMQDVPQKVKDALTIIPVKHEMEVLKQALVRPPQPLPDEQLIASSAFAQVADREALRALVREELSNIFAGAAQVTAKEPANDVGSRVPAAATVKTADRRPGVEPLATIVVTADRRPGVKPLATIVKTADRRSGP